MRTPPQRRSVLALAVLALVVVATVAAAADGVWLPWGLRRLPEFRPQR